MAKGKEAKPRRMAPKQAQDTPADHDPIADVPEVLQERPEEPVAKFDEAKIDAVIAAKGGQNLTLIQLIIDDTTSIESFGNKPVVCAGANLLIQKARAAEHEPRLLLRLVTINGTVIHDCVRPSAAKPIAPDDYPTVRGTPLNREMVRAIGFGNRKIAEYGEQGVDLQVITFVVTDGCNFPIEPEHVFPLSDTRDVVERAIASGRHIVCGMGIRLNNINFENVFSQMGIIPKWIISSPNDPLAIANSFRLSSATIIYASSSRDDFKASQARGVNS